MAKKPSPKPGKKARPAARVARAATPAQPTAARFLEQLQAHQSNVELKKYHRFFTFEEGNRKDTFIGVRMGHVFALAAAFVDMPLVEIEKLLDSHIHEARAGACSIMAKQATHKSATNARRAELSALYLRRHDRINNWDLVDLAAHKVLGNHLWSSGESRAVLQHLARSKDLWERRTAIVATMWFIGRDDLDDTFKIAQLLLQDPEDLVHKGVGWALRYAGASDRARLVAFLERYAARMPRVMLRAALEHFDKKQREHFLGKTTAG